LIEFKYLIQLKYLIFQDFRAEWFDALNISNTPEARSTPMRQLHPLFARYTSPPHEAPRLFPGVFRGANPSRHQNARTAGLPTTTGIFIVARVTSAGQSVMNPRFSTFRDRDKCQEYPIFGFFDPHMAYQVTHASIELRPYGLRPEIVQFMYFSCKTSPLAG
jgi:hypothetical protein